MENDAEMHQLLGSLKADMESSQRQREALFNMMRDCTAAISAVQSTVMIIQFDLKKHMEKENLLQEDHDTLKGRVSTLEGDKKMIVGGVAILTIITSGAWAKIMGILS